VSPEEKRNRRGGKKKKKKKPKKIQQQITNSKVKKSEEEEHHQRKLKQGVCHSVALPFTLKCILRQKKNYGNSNISPCKNIIFKKSSKRKPKSFKILIL
jgi:hypothetical protein